MTTTYQNSTGQFDRLYVCAEDDGVQYCDECLTWTDADERRYHYLAQGLTPITIRAANHESAMARYEEVGRAD